MRERQMTLADIHVDIRSSPTLPEIQQRSIIYSLDAFARVVGTPLDSIDATVPEIRALISKARPARANLKRKSWQTYCSGVWKALELSGVAVSRVRGHDAEPEWATLLSAIPERPHRLRLAPIIKFCSTRKIKPIGFNQDSSHEMLQFLQTTYSRGNHWRSYRNSIRMWERCRCEFPECWPQNPIKAESSGWRYTAQWHQFGPLEGETDRMIEQAIKPSRTRSIGVRPIRPTTARQRKYAVRRVASLYCVATGASTGQFTRLADLCDPAVMETVVDYLAAKHGTDHTGDAYHLCRHIIAIANHWVKVDPKSLEMLRNIMHTVAPRVGHAQKNIELLRLFRDPALQLRFLEMPGRVLARLRRVEHRTQSQLLDAQAAAAAAILPYAPIRSANLAMMEMGQHLKIVSDQQRRPTLDLQFLGSETKTGIPLHHIVPASATRDFSIYWSEFRPRFRCSEALVFPSLRGSKQAASKISQRLARLTSRELGVRVTAHQWRHLVGLIYLSRVPGDYETVRQLLGHRNVRTTQLFYAFMLAEDAATAFDRVVETILHPTEGRSL